MTLYDHVMCVYTVPCASVCLLLLRIIRDTPGWNGKYIEPVTVGKETKQKKEEIEEERTNKQTNEQA